MTTHSHQDMKIAASVLSIAGTFTIMLMGGGLSLMSLTLYFTGADSGDFLYLIFGAMPLLMAILGGGLTIVNPRTGGYLLAIAPALFVIGAIIQMIQIADDTGSLRDSWGILFGYGALGATFNGVAARLAFRADQMQRLELGAEQTKTGQHRYDSPPLADEDSK